jgi:hypothetical protein
MMAVELIAVSCRVRCAISIRVGVPRPSSPIGIARVPANSTSDDALERLPSLSFRRWMRKMLRASPGSERNRRKQVTPFPVLARVREPSLMGAEQNHLWPVRSYSGPSSPSPAGVATVAVARRSEPPCFSVIAMPMMMAILSL